jgi:RNA polymerase-binding protein DksA
MEQSVVRQQLKRREADLLGRVQRITNDFRHSEGLEADFAEQGVQLENDDVLSHLDDASRVELSQIRKALARLDRGQYGICEACNQPIAAKRLQALPCAAKCLRCES